MFPSAAIPVSERKNCVRFLVGFCAVIVTWAVVHDLNLVRIEPRHFTEFHRPLLPIRSPSLLAIQYALVASVGPGLLFGGITFCLCRLGSRPRISLWKALRCFLPILVVIEGASLLAGFFGRRLFLEEGLFLYPEIAYPDTTPGILFTQSANITAYLAAFGCSLLFFIALAFVRIRLRSPTWSSSLPDQMPDGIPPPNPDQKIKT